jgi:hypothetical protein
LLFSFRLSFFLGGRELVAHMGSVLFTLDSVQRTICAVDFACGSCGRCSFFKFVAPLHGTLKKRKAETMVLASTRLKFRAFAYDPSVNSIELSKTARTEG